MTASALRPAKEGRLIPWIVALWCAVAAPNVHAGYLSGFESPEIAASASGIALNGQGGYYLPVAGSSSFSSYTYAGNSLGISQNPTGGSQFVAGVVTAANQTVRSQHDIAPTNSGSLWLAADVLVANLNSAWTYGGTIGSLSVSDSTSGSNEIQFVFANVWKTWTSPSGTAWDPTFGMYNANGVFGMYHSGSNLALAQNNWYRLAVLLDLDKNRVMEIDIDDLTHGSIVEHIDISGLAASQAFYLSNGAGAHNTITNVRLFATGDLDGNVQAFDNIRVGDVPEPASLALLGLGLAAIGLGRHRKP